MNELDKTLKQQLDEISPDVIQEYLKTRETPEIQIGELVHYWDIGEEVDLDRSRVGVYEGYRGRRYEEPFLVNGTGYRHIARPTDFPAIRTPFYGNKRPVNGNKRVTVWKDDGCIDSNEAGQLNWDNTTRQAKITHYMVHR